MAKSPVAFGVSRGNTVSEVFICNGNGHGSTNTTVRRYSTILANSGPDLRLQQDAALGDSIIILSTGVYAWSFSDFSSTAEQIGITRNNTTSMITLTTSGPAGAILAFSGVDGLNIPTSASGTGLLQAGDVLRVVDQGSTSGGNYATSFHVTRVA